MSVIDLALEPQPGTGVVARWGAVALVIQEDDYHPEASELIGIARNLAGHAEPGRLAAHHVARTLTAMDPERVPTFCLVADADRGVAVMMQGAIELTATGPDVEVTLVGDEKPTWVDEYLTADIRRVAIGRRDAAAPEPEPSAWPVDLTAGAVPGGGLVLRPRTTPPPVVPGEAVGEAEGDDESPETVKGSVVDSGPVAPAPAADEPEPPEAAPAEYELVDLSAPAASTSGPLPTGDEQPPPAPDEPEGEMVLGIRCKRDHFNHPDAANCVICGVSMVQQTLQLERGPRPALGLLVFDDGTTFSVDTAYVIGREPDQDPLVTGGSARPIARPDPDSTLSRVHAEIRLDGWDVQVVDRGSANGTLCWQGQGQWQTVTPDDPLTLRSGATVRMASHSFVFESHHKAGHQ